MNIHVTSVHKGEKPFKCDICDYSCPRKGNLNRHVQSFHDGKKPFKCDICNYSCSLKNHLNKHVGSVHEGKKPYQCEFCNCRCSQRGTVRPRGTRPQGARTPQIHGFFGVKNFSRYTVFLM